MEQQQVSVSVNYHGLPDYLRKEAIRRAASGLGMRLSDLMLGRVEFGLSALDPSTERRNLITLIRTSIQ
ncbi:MAG: hypothetical protein IPO60_09865 [Flavobacteriales bacterium]|nr:hypothetical protein [Flavobacteriales bacterium]MBK7247300.1 hypothetical protein [Flavobacteriales bacterium]MBK7285943.1 hypothetical protein [Flavobacteriales bacterium]MBK9598597.1 hypothetical protein [Flavobacteriales bacterium]HQY04153.1 hypothetical protein [Flavobacteriales bacterium]